MICSAAHEPTCREVYRLTADLRTAIDVRDARYLVEASEASGIIESWVRRFFAFISATDDQDR